MSPIEISLIIPAKDEEESIPILAAELESILDRLRRPWECIWIDDGSGDGTLEALRRLRARRTEHEILSFDRNYGQSAALAAGFAAARGAWIVTLDADLQNDPAEIPHLLAPLARGSADMVNGVRRVRRDRWARRWSSRLANTFRNWMTGEHVSDVGCSLRAMRAACVQALPVFDGMHRFLPTLVRIRGHRIVEVPVNHRPRSFGRAKYGIRNRLWVGLADTVGVRWLKARTVQPEIRFSTLRRAAREEPHAAPLPPGASPPAAPPERPPERRRRREREAVSS